MQRDVNEIGDRIVIAPKNVMLVKSFTVIFAALCALALFEIIDYLSIIYDPPAIAPSNSPIAGLIIYILLILANFLTFYERVIRPPRIELTHAGISKFNPYRRRQFWPWSALGPFHRGTRPFCIEAPRTDDPSSFVYLPDWTLNDNEKLFTILNDYRANRATTSNS